MNRTQAIQSLTVQETIINALNEQYSTLNRRLAWAVGDEYDEIKALMRSVSIALSFAYRLNNQSNNATAWKHNAPVNPFFRGAEPAKCGEDY
jgi:hypothetical protein